MYLEIMWRRILIFALLVGLYLTYAVQIMVKECPTTETAWNARSKIFICGSSLKYHCIQDEKKDLMETCMKAYYIDPSIEGGCPWASHFPDGKSILSIEFHPCQGTGCPQRNDSAYWTYELYKYPRCLNHQDEVIKVTRGTNSVSDVTNTPISDVIENDAQNMIALAVVIPAIGIILLFAFICRRRKCGSHNHLEEEGNTDKQPLHTVGQRNNTDESVPLMNVSRLHQFETYLDNENEERQRNDSGESDLTSCHVENVNEAKKRDVYMKAESYQSSGLQEKFPTIPPSETISSSFERDSTGKTCVHTACLEGKIDLVKDWLFQCGGALNNMKDNNGITPFHYAGFVGSVELIQSFLDNGCNVNITDDMGRTIVHFACLGGQINLLKYLIDRHKEFCNYTDNNGMTPFHSAGISGSVEIVKYLIDNGCEMCSKDYNGKTIVHYACNRSHVDLVKFCITMKRNVLSIKDKFGMTPFHYAGYSGSVELVQLLKVYGCEFDSRDQKGQTILHNACKMGHINLVRYLIEININDLTEADQGMVEGKLTPQQVDNGLIQVDKGVIAIQKNGIRVHHTKSDNTNKNKDTIQTNMTRDEGINKTTTKNEENVIGEDKINLDVVNKTEELGGKGMPSLDKAVNANTWDYKNMMRDHKTKKQFDEDITDHEDLRSVETVVVKVDIGNFWFSPYKALLKMKDCNGLTAFHHSVNSGSVELVKYLIEKGCDVKSKDHNGRTIMHYACGMGQCELVKYLIKIDKELLILEDHQRMSPCHMAGISGSVNIATYLSEEDDDLFRTDIKGWSIVHYACQKGHLGLVQYLLKVNKSALRLRDNTKMTPFHCAGYSGSSELVAFLISEGGDVRSQDFYGRTIVHNACKRGYLDLVNIFEETDKSVFDIRDSRGMTPFLYAGFSGSLELVKYLYENGCNLYRTDEDRNSVVHILCREGHVDVVKFLIDRDKNILSLKNSNGMTPFHLAGLSGSVELVQYLIDEGCDIYSHNKIGRTIVHFVCTNGHIGVMKFLMSIDKNVLNIIDFNGVTPFHFAGRSGSVELVQYLMENGGDLYSTDNDGYTIIHNACLDGHLDVVKILLQYDPKIINIKDNNGNTPINLAVLSGSTDLLQYIFLYCSRPTYFIKSEQNHASDVVMRP